VILLGGHFPGSSPVTADPSSVVIRVDVPYCSCFRLTSPSAPVTAPLPEYRNKRTPCLAVAGTVRYLMGASGGGAGNISIVLGIRNRSPRPCGLEMADL